MGYVDYKCTVWNRIHFPKNKDMNSVIRVLKASEYNINEIFENGCEMETLFDAEEYIPCDENQASTIQVYNNDGELLYENMEDMQ